MCVSLIGHLILTLFFAYNFCLPQILILYFWKNEKTEKSIFAAQNFSMPFLCGDTHAHVALFFSHAGKREGRGMDDALDLNFIYSH